MSELAEAVRTACIWEARARKAGNVHPEAPFPDLSYDDFVRSADAIAPVLEEMVDQTLGITILEAIRATRRVVKTNTNLGIVLLLTPLSKCPPPINVEKIDALIRASTIDDAKYVYEAIRLAQPGGLGEVKEQDVATEPTQTLRDVMALAAERDMIARQYVNNFRELLEDGVAALLDGWHRFGNVEDAIRFAQVQLLSRFPDSLIVRKWGMARAEEVMHRARSLADAASYLEFDRWLRDHRINPGTTADLIAACLYLALRERRLTKEMPFEAAP